MIVLHSFPEPAVVKDGAEVRMLQSHKPGSERTDPFLPGSNGDCMVQALTARGIPWRRLGAGEITDQSLSAKPVITFQVNGARYYFDNALRVHGPRAVPGHLIDGTAARFVKQKDLVRSLLIDHAFRVPYGAAFARGGLSHAESFFVTLLASAPDGVCMKPVDNAGSRHVHIGVRDLPSFRAAFAAIGQHSPRVLIEDVAPGRGCRFLCVAGRVVGVVRWCAANVEGDGEHTIAELVERKNALRRLNPAYARHPLRLNNEVRAFLQRSGLDADHVLAAGKVVNLKPPPNEDEATDITETVHRSHVALVERAVALLPDLVICGADLMIVDPCKPASEGNDCFLELNTRPAIRDHHYPWRGRSRHVAGAILDYLTGLRH